MPKKAAAKKTSATAKTPKKSIAPLHTDRETTELADRPDGQADSENKVDATENTAGTPPAGTDGEGEMPGDRTAKPQKPANKSSAPIPRPTEGQTEEAKDSSSHAGSLSPTATQAGTSEQGENQGDAAHTPQPGQIREGEKPGDNRFSSGDADSPAAASQVPPQLALACARLPGEGRAACWERLRKAARAVGMPRGQGHGTAYEWATRETDRLFPPPEPVVEEEPPAEPEPEPVAPPPEPADEPAEPAAIAVAPAPPKDDQGVSGLSDLPPSWPELPANAQLQVEIAWVTANRLRVRDGTGVNLSKALSPAPSYSALSWLETSILFPAKFADISVKATADQDSEREFIRREKISIEEMRSILAEMLEDPK